jgi:hypothetical protein
VNLQLGITRDDELQFFVKFKFSIADYTFIFFIHKTPTFLLNYTIYFFIFMI